MSPEHQEFLSAFTAKDQPAQPTIPAKPKSEYEQAFADFTKADAKPGLGSGQYGLDSVHALTMGVGDASPTVLENTAQGTGTAMGTAEGSETPASPEVKKMPPMSSGAYPQIRPDRSADEYINSFNSMARADAADRAAAARSSAQEAAKLAGK